MKSTNDYFLFQQLWNFIEEDDDEGDKYYNCTAELFLSIDVTVLWFRGFDLTLLMQMCFLYFCSTWQ